MFDILHMDVHGISHLDQWIPNGHSYEQHILHPILFTNQLARKDQALL